MEFKLGELFSGPSGLGLGAEQAIIKTTAKAFSIKHQWAVDFDADSCDTYRKNICPASPQSILCQDVITLDFSLLPNGNKRATTFSMVKCATDLESATKVL